MEKKVYDRIYYQKTKELRRLRYEASKTTSYQLYYMPEEHYIGVTNIFSKRMNAHRAKGRITDGAHVVANFKTKQEALAVEAYMHDKLGYRGKHHWARGKFQKNKYYAEINPAGDGAQSS